VGLFDLGNSVWGLIDSGLQQFLPRGAAIILWGGFAGASSMVLYWLLSSQNKIAGLKSKARTAQQAVLAYDGDFKGVLPLVRSSLRYSLRHLTAVFLPALGASLPLLFLLAWLSTSYGYRFPEPGAPLRVCGEPAGIQLRVPSGGLWSQPGEDCGVIEWPRSGDSLSLRDAEGNPLVALPSAAAVPVIHKKQWWNLLLGNPAGYLDEASTVSAVHLGFPRVEVLAFGPSWLRTWEAPFFLPLILVSLLLKRRFRIH
jgi:hypothetical protein